MTIRALLIGGHGLLGRALLRSIPPDVAVAAPTRAELPLEDLPALEAQWTSGKTTHLILTAAFTRVDDCEADPDRAFLTNAILPGRVARAAARRDIVVTYVSTDYVFSGTSSRPYRESDPVAPVGVYARSKWAGECEVRAADPNHRILRTSGLYGPGGPDFLAAVVPRLRRGEADVVTDQILAPTAVDVLAPAVWSAALGPEPGTFHLTCGGAVSWFDFARRIASRIGVPPERVRPTTTAAFGRPAPRPAYSVLDGQRARVLLGIALPAWDAALDAHLAAASASDERAGEASGGERR